ncbi:MAG: PH domain-containing protein [Microthrixaceae bacterium]
MTDTGHRPGSRQPRPPIRAARPGSGQSRQRASRGWHPDTIVDAYLVPGERIIVEESRSVRGFLMNQVILISVVVLLLLTIAMLGQTALTTCAFLLSAGFVGFIGARALQAWFTRYVVTDLRVLRVSGVLNRRAEFIPWKKITDITRSESLLQWWARTATICIESASDGSGFRSIEDVDDPARFYRVLVEMVDRKQGRLSDVTLSD